MWEYVKGSEADFEGAPEWATECVWSDKGSEHFVYWLDKMTCRIQSPYFSETKFNGVYGWANYVKAARRKVDNLQSRVNDANLQQALTGLRVNYYLAQVKQPQREEQKPYQAECEDIIQALGMTFDEGCLFKALWRNASARLDNGKPGQSAVYDAEKMTHYASRIHAWELSK